MKRFTSVLFGAVTFCACISLHAQNVGINATGAAPAASAMLDVSSSSSGMLIPRMTTAQRTAIAVPAQGLEVYDTSTNTFWYYNGTVWVEELSGTNGWMLAGNTLSGTEKLGGNTANQQPVRFFYNGIEHMRFTGATALNANLGTLVIGSTTAVSTLDLVDAVGNANMPYALNGFASGAATGVWGQASSATGFGIYSVNGNASGTGLISTGNNAGATYMVAGSGGMFNGTGMAVVGWAQTAASGTGVVGTGNNVGVNLLVNGSGGAFNGTLDGVYARNTSLGVSEAIYASNGGSICRFDAWSGTTQYKALSSGVMSVSCSVPDTQGTYHALHCPETPEYYFMDYGEGKLVNGKAHVSIDPLLAKHVTVNEKHPLRVYVQLEGECNGVYITNKTDTSFDVVELHNGTSSAPFQWHIVCNVADYTYPNGKQAQFSDIRFEQVPADKETVQPEAKAVPFAPVKTVPPAEAPAPH